MAAEFFTQLLVGTVFWGLVVTAGVWWWARQEYRTSWRGALKRLFRAPPASQGGGLAETAFRVSKAMAMAVPPATTSFLHHYLWSMELHRRLRSRRSWPTYRVRVHHEPEPGISIDELGPGLELIRMTPRREAEDLTTRLEQGALIVSTEPEGRGHRFTFAPAAGAVH